MCFFRYLKPTLEKNAYSQNYSVVDCCWLLDCQATEKAEREIWTDVLVLSAALAMI